MTDKVDFIEVEMTPPEPSVYDQMQVMEQHWDEPSEVPDWAGEELPQEDWGGEVMEAASTYVRGLLIFHLDVFQFHSGSEESHFRDKHSVLFDRLAEQGIETLVLLNVKSGGDQGVRVEYVNF